MLDTHNECVQQDDTDTCTASSMGLVENGIRQYLLIYSVHMLRPSQASELKTYHKVEDKLNAEIMQSFSDSKVTQLCLHLAIKISLSRILIVICYLLIYKMTGSQYKRLLLVAFVPLLLLGVIVSELLVPYDRYLFLLCTDPGLENCRNVGDPKSALYKAIERDYEAWFDVRLPLEEDRSVITAFSMASRRVVTISEIVTAIPFGGSAQGSAQAQLMSKLVGRNATAVLGIKKGEKSIVTKDEIMLFCNSFYFQNDQRTYGSQCYGDGWGGPITYKASSYSDEMLDGLASEMRQEISKKKWDHASYIAIMYPIFIYLFFIISLIIWLAKKSTKYVKQG